MRGDGSAHEGSGCVESQRWFEERGSVGSGVFARFGPVGGVVGALGEGCWLVWARGVSGGILGGGRVGSSVGQCGGHQGCGWHVRGVGLRLVAVQGVGVGVGVVDRWPGDGVG
jgi:hypothetical protein